MRFNSYRLIHNWRLKMSRKKKLFLIFAAAIITTHYVSIYLSSLASNASSETPVSRPNLEALIQDSMKADRGTGCEIPKIDPFDAELTKFSEGVPKISCEGYDWVHCYFSECKVRKKILMQYNHIRCQYQDIIFVTDKESRLGDVSTRFSEDVYILKDSDFAMVSCTGLTDSWYSQYFPAHWSGFVLGFRTVPSKSSSPGLNVAILGFDSASKTGFMRRMPTSYETLVEELGAVVLNGYNILGDGTTAALLAMLAGKNELEMPERRAYYSKAYMDDFPFIFHKLRDNGYRTAYFEDGPQYGTFQYRFNGFEKQPTDHYLRHFYLHVEKNSPKYCVGSTLSYQVMLNATRQFLQLNGKKFIFTFISDISHDNFNIITVADDDFSTLLKDIKKSGYLYNTLLLVMGDHGVRYGDIRDTFLGKLEERLPLMAVRLPDQLMRDRPNALKSLQRNADVLTTPYDVHATLLDVLGMQDKTAKREQRARSLLSEIPLNRSCSEAGIASHWCACLKWVSVSPKDPIYMRAGQALVDFINSLTESVRDVCHLRDLKSVDYLLKHSVDKQVLKFSHSEDRDGYNAVFNSDTKFDKEEYSIKITANPNGAIYETTLIHYTKTNKFKVNLQTISRTNAYKLESGCIRLTHPHLNKYCFCKNI